MSERINREGSRKDRLGGELSSTAELQEFYLLHWLKILRTERFLKTQNFLNFKQNFVTDYEDEPGKASRAEPSDAGRQGSGLFLSLVSGRGRVLLEGPRFRKTAVFFGGSSQFPVGYEPVSCFSKKEQLHHFHHLKAARSQLRVSNDHTAARGFSRSGPWTVCNRLKLRRTERRLLSPSADIKPDVGP